MLDQTHYRSSIFERESLKLKKNLFQETNESKYCFMDFIDYQNQKTFRIVIELFAKKCPLAT